MKELFVVYGTGNVGKTSIIREVFMLLATSDIKGGTDCKVIPYSDGGTWDFVAILEIKGCKIGFISLGDVDWMIEGEFAKIPYEECDIILCAAKSYGKTHSTVMKLCKSFNGVNASKRWKKISYVQLKDKHKYIRDKAKMIFQEIKNLL